MTDTHATSEFQRWCEVAVIGGSAAGLSAALMLARSRRSVIVIDAGQPRNAPAAHMHGFLGHEGVPPREFLTNARDEVRRYGVEILHGRVTDVTRDEDGRFRVVAGDQLAISARRVVVATGLVDELPDFDGLAEQWGRGVIHCPYCHGYEVRDRRIVVIATSPLSLHQATLFRQLTSDVTVVAHDLALDDPAVDALRARGVRFIDAPADAVELDSEGALNAVRLEDGASLAADAVVVTTRFRVRVEPFASIGLEPVDHPSGLGAALAADERGATSVPGVYAAGNVVDPSQQVVHAAAQGSRVGAMVNVDLAEEDTRVEASTTEPSPVTSDWDTRYSGEQLWSGNPNGTLVAEAASLEPGRALDVGCGEGADAVWLAERGWKVTAVDIAQAALDHGAAAASERRTEGIDWVRVDLAEEAPERAAYDLVSLQYSALQRDADGRTARSLFDAVAPGGTLLVVGHDLDENDHSGEHAGQHADHAIRPFDPLAYIQPDGLAVLIEAEDDWEVVTHERRARPGGHVHEHQPDHMHHRDVVLRARRRPALS